MKVTIARLRSNVKYEKPLYTVLDSYFELLKNWMSAREDIEFQFYNVSFDGTRPKRELKETDVWIIPSDAEYMYYDSKRSLDPRDIEKSNKHIEALRPYVDGKHVIMLCSDRGDTEELFRTKTFEGINLASFTTIDEIDFPANVHGMKYHFISALHTPLTDMIEPQKDFIYWGRMKDDSDRTKFMRQVYRDPDLSQIMIGGFPSGVQRDHKWIKNWPELFTHAKEAKCTMCFNWKDMTATTSRYIEALACGVIPLVWKTYDTNNTYNIADWQRCNSFEDFKARALDIRQNYGIMLSEVRDRYKEVLLSPSGYQSLFDDLINKSIGKHNLNLS